MDQDQRGYGFFDADHDGQRGRNVDRSLGQSVVQNETGAAISPDFGPPDDYAEYLHSQSLRSSETEMPPPRYRLAANGSSRNLLSPRHNPALNVADEIGLLRAQLEQMQRQQRQEQQQQRQIQQQQQQQLDRLAQQQQEQMEQQENPKCFKMCVIV